MADIKVRIELNKNAESEKIGSIKTDNLTFANTSIQPDVNGKFENILTNKNKGINALTFGQELYFNENGMLDNVDNYGGGLDSEKNKFEIVWGIVNSDNTYNVKITFENATDLKDIVIYGDKESKQFPTRAILDGETEVFSDDHIWTLQFENASDTHTIEFTHWNRANYNAVLTAISIMGQYIELDKYSGLKSAESLSQSTGQPSQLFYGVVPSTGSLEVIDLNGEIGDMVRDGFIPKNNIEIDLYANGSLVQQHLSGDAEYEANSGSRGMSINLENSLSRWDKINYTGYRLNKRQLLHQIFREVLGSLYESSEIAKMTSVDVLRSLQTIWIEFPYITKGTFRETIDKICTLAQLNVYQLDDGQIKFVSARPIISSNQDIIKIPSKNQQGSFDRNLIVTNDYKSVNVDFNDTKLVGLSLYTTTIKAYEVGDTNEGFKNLPNYKFILDDNTIYPQITLLRSSVGSINNPTGLTVLEGGFWYYYIAKFELSYDQTDLTILRNFIPETFVKITSLFPMYSDERRTNSDTTIGSISNLYSYSKTDEEIISEWYDGGKIKSGTRQFETKVRLNQDGSYTIFYLSLYLITDRSLGYYHLSEINVNALYNQLNLDVYAPQIKQSPKSLNEVADITVSSNELLQDSATYLGNKLIYNIENNILTDYKSGISTGTITVNCSDYYNIGDVKVKDWAKGEILQVGDIVRVDKDNNGNSAVKYADGSDMYFRVTGRTFRYSGVPLIDLELQEVKVVD